MITTNVQLSEQIVTALTDLYGEIDMRVIARYLVNLTSRAVRSAESISLHVYFPDRRQFATMGVFALPHFGSTLVTDEDSALGRLMSSRQVIWARTPGEAAALYDIPDDGSLAYSRTRDIHRCYMTSPHGSLIIMPCKIGEHFIASLWVDNLSRPGAFSATDRTRLSQVARLSAVTLTGSRYATILTESGLSERWAYDSRHKENSNSKPASSAPNKGPEATLSPANNTGLASSDSQNHLALTPPLSNREREVLDLIVAGYTNQQIAQLLVISVNTVRTHRRSLMMKYDAHNVVELIARATN